MISGKKELYKQIYKVTYIANINRLIEETKYIKVMQQLSMNGFKMYHINNFDKLIIYLQNIGLTDSFNISILIYLRDINYKRLSEIAIVFDDIGKIFSYKKRKMVMRVNKIRRIIKNKMFVIKSFKKFDRFVEQQNDNNFGMIQYDNSELLNYDQLSLSRKITNSWVYHNRLDIMNRLHLLVEKYYSLEQMRYMDVDIKHVNEICDMNYNDLESYYTSVIEKIYTTLKEWLSICRMYIDIEVNYLECCENIINGEATKLELKHFNIDVTAVSK